MWSITGVIQHLKAPTGSLEFRIQLILKVQRELSHLLSGKPRFTSQRGSLLGKAGVTGEAVIPVSLWGEHLNLALVRNLWLNTQHWRKSQIFFQLQTFLHSDASYVPKALRPDMEAAFRGHSQARTSVLCSTHGVPEFWACSEKEDLKCLEDKGKRTFVATENALC